MEIKGHKGFNECYKRVIEGSISKRVMEDSVSKRLGDGRRRVDGFNEQACQSIKANLLLRLQMA